MNLIEKIELLKKLKVDQKSLWGKMTPQHMVEHLYKTLQASINEISLNIFTEERKIPVLKILFLGDRTLPKEFMNPAIGPDLMKLEFEDLKAAILQLENILIRYEQFFKDNLNIKTVHPIFGHLTKSEWDIFHQKHFHHHFSQFGLSD
jgi:hypothetical protein